VASPQRANFRQAALASGLLTKEELEEAIAVLCAASETGRITERILANHFVEQGKLNRWQAEQLLNGRVKWNLGPYRILDAIGQGGMGQVFQAEHTIMRRLVAIKVLPLSKSTPEAIQSFRREVQAQAQLDHENLVRAYDAGQDGNVHYLVTEFVPGLDLRKFIKRHGKLDMHSAAAIISQAARGLEHAHSRGLIHRDVKPGNLLVTPDGRCKVSDLGLAGYLHDAEESNRTVGTADYLSPEQIMTPGRLTPASDVYSLGCTLYYAVTGKVPFPGGNTREKARKHCYDHPIDPRRLNPDLDDEFVDVLADMMAKRPEDRIPTAADVIHKLAPWAGSNWLVAAEAKVIGRSGHDRPPPLPTNFGSGPDTKPIVLDGLELDDRQESGGVSSDGTLPVYMALEETLPLDSQTRFALPKAGLPAAVWVAISLGIVAVIAVIGLILAQVAG